MTYPFSQGKAFVSDVFIPKIPFISGDFFLLLCGLLTKPIGLGLFKKNDWPLIKGILGIKLVDPIATTFERIRNDYWPAAMRTALSSAIRAEGACCRAAA